MNNETIKVLKRRVSEINKEIDNLQSTLVDYVAKYKEALDKKNDAEKRIDDLRNEKEKIQEDLSVLNTGSKNG